MKRFLESPISLIVAFILAWVGNIAYSISGGNTTPFKWLHLAITVLYIVVWLYYLMKGKYPLIGTVVFSLTLIASIVGFIIAKFRLLADWFIIPAVLFATPFTGLQAFIKSTFCWLAVAVISVIMIVLSLKRRNVINNA